MSIEKVKEYFKQFGIEDKIIELSQSSATVELAAIALGCEGQRIAKTLSFLVEEKTLSEDHYSLVMQADIAQSSFAIKKAHLEAQQDEYEQIKSVPLEQIESFLSSESGRDINIANYILGQKGYLTLESNCA